jgi:hypothetical protein
VPAPIPVFDSRVPPIIKSNVTVPVPSKLPELIPIFCPHDFHGELATEKANICPKSLSGNRIFPLLSLVANNDSNF